MANLELNNVRDNKVYVQLNVNGKGWNGYCTKAPSHETTNITIKDANGDTPSSVTSLFIRFHKNDNPDGSGKGDLDAQASSGANAAVVVVGGGSGDPTYNACLALEQDNSVVSTVFGYIESTS
jgi:hypothetical protein